MFCPFPPSTEIARIDPYRYVHKALRASLARLLCLGGRTDFTDAKAFASLHAELDAVVELLRTLDRTEVLFLDSLLDAHAPGQAAGVQHDHLELEQELFEAVRALEPAGRRQECGHVFYLRLSRFVARYLVHMADEEERVLPLLHRHVDERVLRRAVIAAQASIPDRLRARIEALVMDAISDDEREALTAPEWVPLGPVRRASTRPVDPRAVVRSDALERTAVQEG